MLSEQEQIRRNSLAELYKLGINPYPQAAFNNPDQFQEVTLAGRIMSRRIMGAASFCELQDSKGRIQLYIKRDEICPEEDKTLYNTVFKRLLDIGDFIGVKGFAFRTQMGEISVHVKELTVLSKSLRPLPIVKEKDGVKYDEFNDPELRYRMRYVDLVVNDKVKDIFIARTRIIDSIRRFFNESGYLEVETPVLQAIPGGATARPFITHHNALDIPMYLRIADELYLKRLIVGGFEGVYEFSRNFRNEGMDRTHERAVTEVLGTDTVKVGDNEICFKRPFKRITMIDSIKEKTGIDITGMDEAQLRDVCKQLGIEVDDSMGKGKLIDEIFGEKCEGTYIQPTFITDYPVEMSPLCKRHRNACTLRGADETQRARRRRGHVHRPGLPARFGIWYASDFRYGHRHRPFRDAAHGSDHYPRGAAVPDDASREGREECHQGRLYGFGYGRDLGHPVADQRLQHRRAAES